MNFRFVYKNIAQLPLIYKCLVCLQIPTNAYQDINCGILICQSCRKRFRKLICDCKITRIDYITFKTIQQIQINCQLCQKNISYLQFNKHLRKCQKRQSLLSENQNARLIQGYSKEKLTCNFCKLWSNIFCKHCEIENNCRGVSKKKFCSISQIKQYYIISEENLRNIQDNFFQCNICFQKINNIQNHQQQCQQLIITCGICKYQYQRKNYLAHVDQCLKNKLISLEKDNQIQNQILNLSEIHCEQAGINFLMKEFWDIRYDCSLRDDETD